MLTVDGVAGVVDELADVVDAAAGVVVVVAGVVDVVACARVDVEKVVAGPEDLVFQ